MKKIIVLIICAITYYKIISQVTFQSIFSGGTNMEYGNSIVQSQGNNYYLCGKTMSNGDDAFVANINYTGTLLWSTIFSGGGQRFNAVTETNDGGCLAVGHAVTLGAGNGDLYVTKIDSIGNVAWVRTIGKDNSFEQGNSVVALSDGGFIICGTIIALNNERQIFLTKIDGGGNVQWAETIGTSSQEGNAIDKTTDGGFVITGKWASDMFIGKFNSLGSLLWVKRIGGNGDDIGTGIVGTSDGGCVAVGTTTSYGAGNGDIYVVKLDNSGLLQWTRTIGSSGWENGRDIIQLANSNLVIVGEFAGTSSVPILEIDILGNFQWIKSINGGIRNLSAIHLTTDGGFVVTGDIIISSNNYDVYVEKFDATGSTCNTNITIPTIQINTGGNFSTITTNANAITVSTGIGGSVTSGGQMNSICLNNPLNNEETDNGSQNILIYPIPAKEEIYIQNKMLTNKSIDIYNLLGITIYSLQLETQEQARIDVSTWKTGVYFIRIRQKNMEYEYRKIVIN